MTTSFDQLTQLTGVPHEDMLHIWHEVRANSAKLASCNRHVFAATEPGKLGTRYECYRCGGRTDVSSVHWYQLGIAQADAVK